MCDFSKYNEEEHYKRFAIWAASRAASRGQKGLTNEIWKNALRNINVNCDSDPESFDEAYCCVIEELKKSVNCNIGPISFGRAAKFLAVYNKVMFRHCVNSVSGGPCHQFSHPPIDRTLLKNVAKKYPKSVYWNQSTRLPKWTSLDKDEYIKIVKQLRSVLPHDEPFWKIECYWSPIG